MFAVNDFQGALAQRAMQKAENYYKILHLDLNSKPEFYNQLVSHVI